MSNTWDRHRHLAGLAGVALVALATHRQTLDWALLGSDSYASIIASRIRNFGDLIGTFGEVLMDGRFPFGEYYRPVGNLFMALDYSIWELDSFGYQLTSVLLFSATVGMLYFATHRMLGPDSRAGPSVAALFFALHPSALSVLPFVERRTELLALTCTLTAFALLSGNGRHHSEGRHAPCSTASCSGACSAASSSEEGEQALSPPKSVLVPMME